MDWKGSDFKNFLWLFLFFQKVDFKFTTQEKHGKITFLGITLVLEQLQKWQTPFWNRINEQHLMSVLICHNLSVLYYKNFITCLG